MFLVFTLPSLDRGCVSFAYYKVGHHKQIYVKWLSGCRKFPIQTYFKKVHNCKAECCIYKQSRCNTLWYFPVFNVFCQMQCHWCNNNIRVVNLKFWCLLVVRTTLKPNFRQQTVSWQPTDFLSLLSIRKPIIWSYYKNTPQIYSSRQNWHIIVSFYSFSFLSAYWKLSCPGELSEMINTLLNSFCDFYVHMKGTHQWLCLHTD